MVTSIVVFCSIILISLVLSIFPVVNYNSNITISICYRKIINILFKYVIPIIVVTLLIGLRYNVGKDWLTYNLSYQFIDNSSLQSAINQQYAYEWLYTVICYVLKSMSFPSYSQFIVFTFIIICLYYASYCRFNKILPYGIFTLYTLDPFYLYLNIMRQGVAFFILLYVVRFIKDKKPILYLVGVIIAAGFHKTSLLFIPFYIFAYYRKLLFSPYAALSLYILSLAFRNVFFTYLMSVASLFLGSEYQNYMNLINVLQMEEGSGLGLLLLRICDVIIILFSPSCYKKFKDKGYDIYYNIFIIGVLIQNVAGMNMLLFRIPFCMTSMRLIVGAFSIYYGLKLNDKYTKTQKKNLYKLGSYLFIFCAMIFFMANIIRFDYSFID